ncbi:RNA ligase family protein [Actinomadura vinacea]|uniref:RNA ligase family protein n=1 Tax=Actinomadura vinacea TaxID=115336 RepID=A0ABP5X281_9ACTN
MLHKYPRTRHIEGSRFQTGDHDLAAVPFRDVAGRYLVVEEKLDGANCGISFTAGGELRLQSRGHFLTGGPRERHFAPLKAWAATVQHALWPRLGDRYVMYGEWLYAKHTMFYDALPHYFCEFDVLDQRDGTFLSTERRRDLLQGTPVVSVPVLHEGRLDGLRSLVALAGPSTCRTARWRDALREAAAGGGADPGRVAAETDAAEEMEGLYIKVEEDGRTVDRLKWVRPSFLNAILDSGTHWLDRPIVANGLADPEVLYAGV